MRTACLCAVQSSAAQAVQCRGSVVPMNAIEGYWSSEWPTAGRPLLGPELLPCWAVSANTFWPQELHSICDCNQECACSPMGNLICVLSIRTSLLRTSSHG